MEKRKETFQEKKAPILGTPQDLKSHCPTISRSSPKRKIRKVSTWEGWKREKS